MKLEVSETSQQNESWKINFLLLYLVMGKCVVASRQFLGVIYSNQNVLSSGCFHKESHLALSLLLE